MSRECANDRVLHHCSRNRESGAQQQLPAAPPPNELRTYEAPARQEPTQVNEHKVADHSSAGQERKTKKQGVDGM